MPAPVSDTIAALKAAMPSVAVVPAIVERPPEDGIAVRLASDTKLPRSVSSTYSVYTVDVSAGIREADDYEAILAFKATVERALENMTAYIPFSLDSTWLNAGFTATVDLAYTE